MSTGLSYHSTHTVPTLLPRRERWRLTGRGRVGLSSKRRRARTESTAAAVGGGPLTVRSVFLRREVRATRQVERGHVDDMQLHAAVVAISDTQSRTIDCARLRSRSVPSKNCAQATVVSDLGASTGAHVIGSRRDAHVRDREHGRLDIAVRDDAAGSDRAALSDRGHRHDFPRRRADTKCRSGTGQQRSLPVRGSRATTVVCQAMPAAPERSLSDGQPRRARAPSA